jgi:hypothetical protein
MGDRCGKNTTVQISDRRSDVAGQTPQAMLSLPKVGDGAVRALVQAAQEAVKTHRDAAAAGGVGAEAAIARLLGQLDDFDRAILSARVWAPHPQSQRVLAERLGVNPVSVQRNQPRAQARFAELLADPAHQEVSAHAICGWLVGGRASKSVAAAAVPGRARSAK